MEDQESKFEIYFNKFKTLWKDKRYRSLFILIFYVIFFAIIFSMLNYNDNTQVYNNNDNDKQDFKNYNIYEFITDVDVNGLVYEIQGKRYNEKYEFTIEEQLFDMNYGEIQESNLDKNIINSFNFTPNLIDNMLENSQLVSEKKIIEDGRIIYEYSLDLSRYLTILDYNLINYNPDDKITIITDNLDDNIVRVELDLTNFYKNLEENYQEYKITISYSNINNVDDF